jgi:hypothetical protein
LFLIAVTKGSKMKKILFLSLVGISLSACGGSSGGGGQAVTGPVSSDTCAATSSCSRTLAWDAVTTLTDGSALPEAVRYRVHYGTASRVYTQSVDAGAATTATVTGLGAGTYYFAVTAYLPTSGTASGFSNEVNDAIDMMRILRPIAETPEFTVTIAPSPVFSLVR